MCFSFFCDSTETMSTTATSMDQHWYALPLIEPPPHKEELSSVSTPSAKHIVCLILFRITSTQKRLTPESNLSCDLCFYRYSLAHLNQLLLLTCQLKLRNMIPSLM